MNTFIIIKFGEENYGVEIELAREIIRIPPVITPVPGMPPFLRGVINLRGKILPVVDFRDRLNVKVGEFKESSRVVVCEINEESFGFIVDEIVGIVKVEGDLLTVSQVIAPAESEYIIGAMRIGNRIISILNLPEIYRELERECMQI